MAELGGLTNLQELKLNGNTDLTGLLPLGLMNLDDLTTVWIQGTGLCAPEDAAFRAWAAAIDDFKGCGGPPSASTSTVPPSTPSRAISRRRMRARTSSACGKAPW